MKKLILLLTLLLTFVVTESFAQRGYSSSRSSYSSYSSHRGTSHVVPSYTRTNHTKPSVTKSSYSKTTVNKPVIPKNIKSVDNRPINKYTVNNTLKSNTSNKPSITNIHHLSKYSNQYIDKSRTYTYGNNMMLFSTAAIMWYTLHYNNDTRVYDTIKAPSKEILEKKVDTWSTTQK